MTIRCGFIGLGIMGNALARNLAPNGLPATVFDIIAMPVTGVVSQVIARIYGVHDDDLR